MPGSAHNTEQLCLGNKQIGQCMPSYTHLPYLITELLSELCYKWFWLSTWFWILADQIWWRDCWYTTVDRLHCATREVWVIWTEHRPESTERHIFFHRKCSILGCKDHIWPASTENTDQGKQRRIVVAYDLPWRRGQDLQRRRRRHLCAVQGGKYSSKLRSKSWSLKMNLGVVILLMLSFSYSSILRPKVSQFLESHKAKLS